MKKSEALSIIQLSIERYFDYSPNMDNKKGAEFVLKQIERIGMAPPNILNPKFEGGRNIQTQPYYTREWEIEDDNN
jgi:hypothetical protein